MYSALERRLLSCPMPGLGLPALIPPVTEWEYFERELALGWHPDEGISALLFTLKIGGVVVIDLTPAWVAELLEE